MGIPFGILDQSIVFPGMTPAEALQNTVKLAQAAERLGYHRFWVSEHHDSAGVAGSSPEVLVSHLLAHTGRIRVGSGGVMLQHYSPFKVAENFNVLASLAPGRVDLGVGRAPGGLPRSTQALQRGVTEERPLEDKLEELEGYLAGRPVEAGPLAGIQATPIPEQPADLYLLGTSVSSAELAAERGYPYAFALFINSDEETARQAFETYRRKFNAAKGTRPYALLALSAIVADTEEEARELAGDHQTVRVTLASGKTVNVRSLEQAEEYARQAGESYTTEVRDMDIAKGTKETVRARILELQRTLGVDEFIFTSIVKDDNRRIRSFELLKEAFQELKI